MFDQWKVLHLDEVESENTLFCRALAEAEFDGHCESVSSIRRAKTYLERALLKPQKLSRPDIIVINWHPKADKRVLDFVNWIRSHPQFRVTSIIVFMTAQLPPDVQEMARTAGVNELIVRPATYEELTREIKEVLEQCTYRTVTRRTGW